MVYIYDYLLWFGDIMVLVCHMISQEHVLKLGHYSHSGNGVKMILVCHMISKDYMIKGSCDLMGGSSPW